MIKILFAINLPIDTLRYLQNINENVDAVKRIVDVSNATIANEISAINTMLVAFTIVFGIVGVFLGVYISWLQRKVSKMSDNIEKKEQTIIALAKTIEETDQKIQSDISGLYAKLRKEETMTLLKRLEMEPQDIANVLDLLLARPLENDGFPILKNAFLKLIKIEADANTDEDIFDSTYKEPFLLLFFQHYLCLSIKDDDLREEIVKGFEHCMACAFKSDIIKSTEDLCKSLKVERASYNKTSILIDYLKALNQSKFTSLIDLKNILQEDINKDLLVDAIDKCTTDRVYLTLFGIEAPNETENE